MEARLPWYTDASTIGAGGTNILYEMNPRPGLSLHYIMPFQLNELSVRKLEAEFPVKQNIFATGLGQSGDQVFQETMLTFGAARNLSNTVYLKVSGIIYNIRTHNEKNGNAIMSDILCLYQPIESLIIGSHLFNPTGSVIEGQARDYHLCQAFYLGGAFWPTGNLKMIIETEKIIGEEASLHGGIEYTIMEALTIRLGLSGKPFITTWGLGGKFNKITCSIGGNNHPVLGITSGISVKYFWR
jgi:hypothetical protein